MSTHEEKSLPTGWKWAKLREISNQITDGTHKTPQYITSGVRFISIANLKPFKPIDWNAYVKYISLEEHKELTRRCKPEKNDILLTKIGTLGIAKLIDFDEEVSIFVGLALIKPNHSLVYSPYLEAFLNSPQGYKQAVEGAQGGGRHTLPLMHLTNFNIPIPSLLEQKRIMSVLSEELTAIEKANVATEAQLEAAQTLPSSYLRKIFNGPDAHRWPKQKLGSHVSKVGSGITPRGGHSSYITAGIPLIRSQNIHINKFVHKGLAFISSEQDEAMKNSRVQKQDVLINITGASIGRVCVAPETICPANVNQHVSIIRCNESLNPQYLSYYLSSPAFQKFIWDIQSGATRQALTKSLIENFIIPIPDVATQLKVVDDINRNSELNHTLVTKLETLKSEISLLPPAILEQAFNGDL